MNTAQRGRPLTEEVNADLLFSLVKDQGTLEQASRFLRSKGLEYSSDSWEQMIESRLKPSFREGKLTKEDLFTFLAEVEEHGRQHIFIYDLASKKAASELFEPRTLVARIKAVRGLPDLGKPSLVEKPEQPTIVEIRYDSRTDAKCLVIKIVEERFLSYNKRETKSAGRLVITYDLRAYRAVHVVRIWDTGRVEIRVYSHREAIDYQPIAESVRSMLAPLVDTRLFRPLHLDNLRDALWKADRRKEIHKQFVLRNSDHKNAAGNRLRASASAIGTTMFDDADLAASVDRFHSAKSRAQCERAGVALKSKSSGGALSRDVNVLFSGAPNEFTITAKLTRDEYEYVLDAVIHNNK
jgi:hypothetical protein